MRHLFLSAALVAAGLAAGCTTPADRAAAAAALDARDRADCKELGFTPDTEAFGNCVLKLKEIRAREALDAAETQPNVGFDFGIGVGVGID